MCFFVLQDPRLLCRGAAARFNFYTDGLPLCQKDNKDNKVDMLTL